MLDEATAINQKIGSMKNEIDSQKGIVHWLLIMANRYFEFVLIDSKFQIQRSIVKQRLEEIYTDERDVIREV